MFLTLVAVSLALRQKLLCLVCAGMAALWLMLVTLDWLQQDDVLTAALSEGCRTAPYSLMAALSVCCLACLLAFRLKSVRRAG
ncbi:hypothetical protein FMN50_05365 [Rhodobacterales bacterium]|nr:hypothetical protein FMN50_05365 [Rhodobacterales bacterium]